MGEVGAGFIIAGVILCLVVIVMWIILPFAIFGTKPLIERLIAEVRKTNEILNRRQGE